MESNCISDHAKALLQKMDDFVQNELIPAESIYDAQLASAKNRWGTIPPIMEEMKRRSKELGLWNLFLHEKVHVESEIIQQPNPPLSTVEYALLSEIQGRSFIAPEVCNCSAPDTGNMETLLNWGTADQKRRWLLPLLRGEIRSAFLMTEPRVASSDATNIETTITPELHPANGSLVGFRVNGRKWWSSGAMDPRCGVYLVLGKVVPPKPSPTSQTNNNYNHNHLEQQQQQQQQQQQEDERHRQHSVILVPAASFDPSAAGGGSMEEQKERSGPLSFPGGKATVIRPLSVFGYDDAPVGHAEVELNNVFVPAENLVGGVGDGFRIAQSRLGPGRVHHCMRLIGLSHRAYHTALARAVSGKIQPSAGHSREEKGAEGGGGNEDGQGRGGEKGGGNDRKGGKGGKDGISKGRVVFGRALIDHGMAQRDLAQSKIDLAQARALVLNAAYAIDAFRTFEHRHPPPSTPTATATPTATTSTTRRQQGGMGSIGGGPAHRGRRQEQTWEQALTLEQERSRLRQEVILLVSMIKVGVPHMACSVIDRAIQVHGGYGLCQDTFLPRAYAAARSLRLADGPDEVHLRTIAKLEGRAKVEEGIKMLAAKSKL